MWNIQDEVWSLFTDAGFPGGQYQSGSITYNPAERMMKGAASVSETFFDRSITNNGTMIAGGSGSSPTTFLRYSGRTAASIASSKVDSAGWTQHALVPIQAFSSAIITRARSLQVSASPQSIIAAAAFLTGTHSFSIQVPAIPTAELAEAILDRFRNRLVDSIDTTQRTLFANLLAEAATEIFEGLSASIAVTGSNPQGSDPPPGTALTYLIGAV